MDSYWGCQSPDLLASPNVPLGGFWGAPPEIGPEPTGMQTLLFIIIGIVQSLTWNISIGDRWGFRGFPALFSLPESLTSKRRFPGCV
jgi:hypothetical protein